MVQGDVLAAYVALLRATRRLLVIDNCEHLLDAVRDTVGVLLEACPSAPFWPPAGSRSGSPPSARPASRPCRCHPVTTVRTGTEGTWYRLTTLALAEFSCGSYADVIEPSLAAASVATRPSGNHGVAALAAMYSP